MGGGRCGEFQASGLVRDDERVACTGKSAVEIEEARLMGGI